jgi:hypothetical protein
MLSIITANGYGSSWIEPCEATIAGDGLGIAAGEALGEGTARPGLGEADATAAGEALGD